LTPSRDFLADRIGALDATSPHGLLVEISVMLISYLGDDTQLLGSLDTATTASISSMLAFTFDKTSTDTAGFAAAIQDTWDLVRGLKVSLGWRGFTPRPIETVFCAGAGCQQTQRRGL